jgi:hypothetical protein
MLVSLAEALDAAIDCFRMRRHPGLGAHFLIHGGRLVPMNASVTLVFVLLSNPRHYMPRSYLVRRKPDPLAIFSIPNTKSVPVDAELIDSPKAETSLPVKTLTFKRKQKAYTLKSSTGAITTPRLFSVL